MRENPLIAEIARILHQQPEGMSEYELMRQLGFDQLDLASDGADAQLVLFRKHFLIMNALYRLQPIFVDEGFLLVISALNIRLEAITVSSSEYALSDETTPAAVRDYYLDWREFDQSSNASVEALLNSFWQRFIAPDKIVAAHEVLALEMPTDRDTVRKQFRRLAAKHHPDKGGDSTSFQRIREAYETLMAVQL